MPYSRAPSPKVIGVTADWQVVRALTQAFRPEVLRVELTPAAGLARLRDEMVRAAIFDADLEEGALDVIAAARRAGKRLPILVVSSRAVPELVNRAFVQEASLLCKPCHAEDFETFGRRAFVSRFAPDEVAERALETFCERAHLSPDQSEIVAAAYAGLTPCETSGLVGRTEDAVRAALGDALRRSGSWTLQNATEQIDALVRKATRGAA